MPHARKSADWLFKNPKARADDLMQAFFDPDIKAVFSTVGGSDSLRIIEHIDEGVIRSNAKALLG